MKQIARAGALLACISIAAVAGDLPPDVQAQMRAVEYNGLDAVTRIQGCAYPRQRGALIYMGNRIRPELTKRAFL
jgi:hypothetical protein